MKVYAIGDLHLSHDGSKSMEVFGWKDHPQRVFQSWQDQVTEQDLVLIAGDTSWAMRLEEAQIDFERLRRLPGKKILVRGNHDYWWMTLKKMHQSMPDFSFLQNNCVTAGDWVIAGTRGWNCPGGRFFTPEDQKIYQREVARLELSLQQAREHPHKTLLVMLHYPPANEQHQPSGFTELIERFGAQHVVYGHLHGKESFAARMPERVGTAKYHLVSCDYLGFELKRIL